ncbi:MAG: WecB/TagA/CpsF family glycosyltransferase, partial [Evtepia sp.]
GIGVVYAGKILGTPLKMRVPGIDFANGLLAELSKKGSRLFLLGAKPGVAETAGRNLMQTYPGLILCGTADGYFSDPAAVAQTVRLAKPDVVFVCLGAPKQERWMAEFGPETGAKLMIGLGGVLDVFAGHVQRAPEFWQKIGLEWFYRLLRQPSRFGRMAKLPLFLVQAAAVRLRGKKEADL